MVNARIGGRAVQPKGGKREDLGGLYLRSKLEANYLRYLKWLQSQGQIDRWEYEPTEFWFPIKRGNRSYKPDFAVWEKGAEHPVYHEVKGWMDADSRVKLARMARHFPDVRVIVVDKAAMASIRQYARLIEGWEE